MMEANKPTETVFRCLLRTCDLVKRVMIPYFARFGISGSQWGVLRALYHAEREGLQSLRLTDLGDRLLIRPPSVTSVVDRLYKMKLVARAASPADLRAKHIHLTPAGRELVERILKEHSAKIESLMSGLSLPEQADLQQLMNRLVSHLEVLAEREEGKVLN